MHNVWVSLSFHEDFFTWFIVPPVLWPESRTVKARGLCYDSVRAILQKKITAIYVLYMPHIQLKILSFFQQIVLNPLDAELNPICHLVALLGAHPILHISRISVNSLIPIWRRNATTPVRKDTALIGGDGMETHPHVAEEGIGKWGRGNWNYGRSGGSYSVTDYAGGKWGL